MHNYELPTRGMHSLECRVKGDIALARGDPANKSVLLVGDFNLQPADEAKIRIDCLFAQGSFNM